MFPEDLHVKQLASHAKHFINFASSYVPGSHEQVPITDEPWTAFFGSEYVYVG